MLANHLDELKGRICPHTQLCETTVYYTLCYRHVTNTV